MDKIGKKAIVIDDIENIHNFEIGMEVEFLGLEPMTGILSGEASLYRFEDKYDGVVQLLNREDFRWL